MAAENMDAAPSISGADKALSNTQKCAILMMLLGEDEAAELLGQLSPREVQHLGSAMFSVAEIDQDTVNSVLDEFLSIIKAQTSLGLGAGYYVRNVLVKALGEDKADSVLSRITPAASGRNAIEVLDWMDARSIAEMISNEHPQIMAIVISHLEYSLGADVLQLLPETLRPDVLQRVATLETVQPDAIRELEQVMQKQFTANTTLRASSIGGISAAAKIMNFTRMTEEQKIMKGLQKVDKALMQSIQENMFTFENLISMDDKSMQTLLRNVDTEELVISLKGADDRLKDKMFGCMSQRAAQNIMDEIEATGPMRITEVQEAQKRVVAVARRLSDAGTIVLAGRGDDFV